ncbi:MAG: tetratricopeptide repeat protein [Acidobacteriota bacterium]|nr:tetratricopeptide repeat protein [Acidobacteriota bacterium]
MALAVSLATLAALAAAQATSPLAQADIDKLLSGGVSPARVATLVEQRGLDFDPDQSYLRNLELRDESGKLGDAVRIAGQKRVLPRAQASLKAQRWAQAEQDYRAAIALDPNSAAAHAGLGTALVQQGRGEAAVPELGQALARDPNNAVAHRGMGMALAQRKEYTGALAELAKAKQLDPNDPVTHVAIGDAMLEQGDANGAMTEFTQAQSLDPNLQSARLGIARAFERKGDLSGAETNYRSLLALDSKNPPANYGMGGLMEKKKKDQEALDFYRVAYTSDPGNAKYREAYEHMVTITVNATVNVNINTPPPQPATGTALLHIYRPSRYLGGAGTFNLTVDGRPVAKMGNGRHFTIRVPVGSHYLAGDHMQNYTLVAQAGQEFYFSIEIGMFQWSYAPRDPVRGAREMAGTKPIEPNRIYDRENIVEAGGGSVTVTPQEQKRALKPR